jgi:uncharacterized membrane-anchored protein
MRKWLIVASVVVSLVGINLAIYDKERHLIEGEQIFLRLAPVDPRSLMQGDYMALRFELARDVDDAVSRGLPCEAVVVRLDARRVASFARCEDGAPLAPDERLVRPTRRGGHVVFGADSFFFEEGKGEVFSAAKYGGMSRSKQGALQLEGLYGEELWRLE